jgi:COP9 signalosome complex subunit 4
MGADGLSVVARAVVQHNMTSCSRIYDNIKLDELAARLHLESRTAMKICMAMIMENRLDAVIDQVEQLLVFRNDTDPFKSWDRHISHVCLSVMRCSSLIRNL